MLGDSLKGVFSEMGNLEGLKSYLDDFCEAMQPMGDNKNKLLFCFVQMFSISLEKPSMYLHNRFPLEWKKLSYC
ncbi:MAG: hypothetical protein P8176_14690 [Gammaproteobacteria bacterium]